MATTKKSEADPLEAILEKLGAMEQRIATMETKATEPPALRMTPEPGDPYKDKKVVQDHLFASAPNLLNEGDVIRLKDTTEKAQTIMANMEKLRPEIQANIKEKGILGVVEDYKLTNARTADPKFRVNFPGIGSDGICMSELEIVERV